MHSSDRSYCIVSGLDDEVSSNVKQGLESGKRSWKRGGGQIVGGIEGGITLFVKGIKKRI